MKQPSLWFHDDGTKRTREERKALLDEFHKPGGKYYKPVAHARGPLDNSGNSNLSWYQQIVARGD